MKLLTSVFLLLCLFISSAQLPSNGTTSTTDNFATIVLEEQLPPADQIPADKSPITVQPITHGTLVLTWNGLTIYNDPFGGAEKFADQDVPDIVLITDIHGDHHNANTLAGLDLSKATIVVPQAVADVIDEKLKDQLVIIGNDETKTVKGISISAIPMYNLPDDETSRHTKGRGNGYILNLGGKNVYISGDTEDIPEMRALKNIDVAFVCMNLPYTMSVEHAADAVSEFKPKIVYPFHYRGPDGLSDTEKFKQLVNANAPEVDVRLRNWYGG